jgi:hypothetical protein
METAPPYRIGNIFILAEPTRINDVVSFIVMNAPSYQIVSNYTNNAIIWAQYQRTLGRFTLISLLAGAVVAIALFLLGKKSILEIQNLLNDRYSILFDKGKNQRGLLLTIAFDFLLLLPLSFLLSLIFVEARFFWIMLVPILTIIICCIISSIFLIRRRTDD